ncbi:MULTISPECIES: hypothetical protein [Clostridium]|uniref:hypothetical protein n=1 Tax=Clostridium TaxID=1485 RepID=UPI0032EE934A
MDKKLTPELKKCKEEFDYLHKKIGELEWERAIMYYDRKGVFRFEIEELEDRIKNYKDNMELLLNKVSDEIRESKKNK